MKEMVLGGVGVVGIGLATFFAPSFDFGTFERVDPAHGPIYALSTGQAVERLLAARIEPGTRPFGHAEIVARKVGDDRVEFTAKGRENDYACTATAFDARSDAIQFKTTCADRREQTSEFAMPAMNEMRAIEFRELVESTMQNRPYNFEKVQSQTAAVMLKEMPRMQQQIGEQMTRVADEMDEAASETDNRNWLETDALEE